MNRRRITACLPIRDDYVLNKGTYTIRPEYSIHHLIILLKVGQRNEGGPVESGKYGWSEDCQRLYLTLDKDSQQLHIRIYYQGVGSLILNTMSLIPQGAFYRDAPYLMVLVILLVVSGYSLRPTKKHPSSREERLPS